MPRDSPAHLAPLLVSELAAQRDALIPFRSICPKELDEVRLVEHSPVVRTRSGLSYCDLTFSHKFFLRDVAWIHSS